MTTSRLAKYLKRELGPSSSNLKATAEFNWTNNKNAAALTEYRRAADQAILVFEISVARESQPLNAPKLMEGIESMLRRKSLSDPQQLIPLLKDISTAEHLPLIARNHALRLIKKIQKEQQLKRAWLFCWQALACSPVLQAVGGVSVQPFKGFSERPNCGEES